MGISDDWQLTALTVVLCVSQMLQFKFVVVLIYYLSTLVPKIASTIILYYCKVLKTFNHHLNHKCKITKVTRNTLHVHF